MSMRVCMVGLCPMGFVWWDYVHEGLYGRVMSMRVCMVGLCPWGIVR